MEGFKFAENTNNVENTAENSEKLQEKIKFEISTFVENKLEEAIELMISNMEEGAKTDVVECLKQIWPENNGVAWQRKPIFDLPDFGLDRPIKIRFDRHSEHDNTSGMITLNVADIKDADSIEDIKLALKKTLDAIYHEVEHIFTPGSDIEPEDIQETIEYMGNSGEIEAHGRQFAYRYIKEFPNEPFDLQKMIKLSIAIKESGENNKYYNYFIAFADQEKQDKYKEYGDVRAINQKIINATVTHFNNLSQNRF